MASMRTFFAIELDSKTRDIIAGAITFLKNTPMGKKLPWVPPEKLHLTLRFLGNTQMSQTLNLLLPIKKALRTLPPFRIELGTISLFPSAHKPRVVVVDIGYSQALLNLFAAVEQATVAAGFPPELRPARPHITLAHLRNGQAPQFHLNLSSAQTGMLVNEIVLLQSIPADRSTKYIPLERIRLG